MSWAWTTSRSAAGAASTGTSTSPTSAICSVRACTSASEKKTTETAYLTVEQVRQAAGAWFEAHSLPRGARWERYQRAAERITYYKQRNKEARRSHTKKTLRRLHEIGIKLRDLPSCMPRTC